MGISGALSGKPSPDDSSASAYTPSRTILISVAGRSLDGMADVPVIAFTAAARNYASESFALQLLQT